jgi:hypothetical protein
MAVPFLVVAIVAGVCSIVFWYLGSTWWKYRGRRVVTCPENHHPAGVTVDAFHVMAGAAMGKAPRLRLDSCSRWPEKAGCGQDCLRQIEASPESCLVRNILLDWYAGKDCCSCDMPIGVFTLAGAKPAVLRPDGTSMEWNGIPAEELQQTLAESKPICFACHMARKMLREHRELVSGLSESTGRPAR